MIGKMTSFLFRYTFRIALLTDIIVLLITASSFYVSALFVGQPSVELNFLISPYFAAAIFAPFLLHLIQWGLLSFAGIPAFSQGHRLVNLWHRNRFVNDPVEKRILYETLSSLPVFSMLNTILYLVIMGMMTAGALYYFHSQSAVLDSTELRGFVRLTGIAFLYSILLSSVMSYNVAETCTSFKRRELLNSLNYSERAETSVSSIGPGLRLLLILILFLLQFAFVFPSAYRLGQRGADISGLAMLPVLVMLMITTGLLVYTSVPVLAQLSDLRNSIARIRRGGRPAFKRPALEGVTAEAQFSLLDLAAEHETEVLGLEEQAEFMDNRIAELEQQLKEKESRMKKQLNMANIIQQSILPVSFDGWNEIKVAVRHMALEEVGGDFYDFYRMKNETLGVVIGDVSGHGIPAALVTSMSKILFSSAAEKSTSPVQIIREVNRTLLENIRTAEFLTCFMLTVDEDYNLSYTNASHQRPVLLRQETGEIELLDTDGLFIGIVADEENRYTEGKTGLNYSDRVILYSDGITEAVAPDGEKYTNARFEKSILRHRDRPLEQFADSLMQDVKRFTGKEAVKDDATIIILELVRDEAVDAVKKAKRLISLHNPDGAVELLEQALEKMPESQKILYNLAKCYFRVNEYGKSIEYILRYIESEKLNKYAYYICGASYYQLSDYGKALRYLDAALNLDKRFVNALFARSMTLVKSGDHAEARACIERILDIDPDNKIAIHQLNKIDEINEIENDKES